MPALQSMPASVELEGLIVGHGGNISAAQRSLAAIIELMRLPDQRFGGVFGLLCLGYGLCTQVQFESSSSSPQTFKRVRPVSICGALRSGCRCGALLLK